MRTWLEHRFDNLVGRAVDWLGNAERPRARPRVRPADPPAAPRPAASKPSTPEPRSAAKPTQKKAAAKTAPAKKASTKKAPAKKASTKKAPAKKASTKKAPAKKPSSPAKTRAPRTARRERPAESFVAASTSPAETETDDLARAVVDALAASADGSAAMAELVDATGASRSTLRTRLLDLQQRGRVERVGAGLKTRYQLVTETS